MDFNKYLALNTKLIVSVWLNDDDDDEDAEEFESYIKDIDFETKRILIDPPSPTRKDLHDGMSIGTTIALTITNNQGKIILYPSIHGAEYTGLTGYWLSIPEDTEPQVEQQRSYVRVTYYTKVQVQPIHPITNEALAPIECMTHNLSGGGIRFAGPEDLKADSNAILHLKLPDETLSLQIRIIKTSEDLDAFPDLSERYVCTASFKNLRAQDETKIINECFRVEREARNK